MRTETQPKKPISQKQLEANRRNAKRCTGPRTQTGKARSALNALRHGITGQVNILTDDDRAAYEKFSAAFLTDLAPEGALELQLAERIVKDNWRLNRAAALEDNIFALGFTTWGDTIDTEHPQVHAALTAARTFTEESKHFQLLTLYEQRINRTLHKNMAEFRQLQAARKESSASARPNKIKALPATAAPNGFVF